jgi:hypothetical protein
MTSSSIQRHFAIVVLNESRARTSPHFVKKSVSGYLLGVRLRAESSVAVGTYRFAVVILSSVQPVLRVHLKSAEFPSQSPVRTEEYLRIQLGRADNISDVRGCDRRQEHFSV